MHVGVIPYTYQSLSPIKGIPHACGGDPLVTFVMVVLPLVFPMHVGVILKSLTLCESVNVFPMHVGVILDCLGLRQFCLRIPHACGGDPNLSSPTLDSLKYSPCMWG